MLWITIILSFVLNITRTLLAAAANAKLNTTLTFFQRNLPSHHFTSNTYIGS